MEKTSKMNDEIRAYATGKQNLEKYKAHFKNSAYVSIKWPASKTMAKIRKKILQKTKPYRMVRRLTNLSSTK